MKSIVKWVVEKIYNLLLPLSTHISKDFIRYYKRRLQREYFENEVTLKGSNISINGLIEVEDYSKMIVGNEVVIGNKCYFNSLGGIVIGDNSEIGESCKFYTIDPVQEEYSNSIYIGNNVLIGNEVTVMPGAIIEDNSIVKSGSVVTKETSYPLKNKSKGRIQPTINSKAECDLFFVVSTGRSGSSSIASVLSQHSEITCYHEPRSQLIRLSTQFEYGQLTYDEVCLELDYLYNKANVFDNSIYGESDQKLSNLILPLSKLFPGAKFIWLIRNGKKVVESTTKRRWYEPEYRFPTKYWGKNREGWKEFRLQGDRCQKTLKEEWINLSPFEKNCWYWNYWNSKISQQLENVSDDRKYILRLEDIQAKTKEIQKFLNVKKIENLNVVHKNKTKSIHKVEGNFWNEDRKKIFEKYCKDLNNRFYS